MIKVSQLIKILTHLEKKNGDIEVRIESVDSWDQIVMVYVKGQISDIGGLKNPSFIGISPFTLDKLKDDFPDALIIDKSNE